ncbi:MAG TPA: hypothetical protein VFC23_05390, partial [Thermoanaerobaculia bacterium]|nr:hypothetical protein [Thermoanaerobaculia bacterium]
MLRRILNRPASLIALAVLGAVALCLLPLACHWGAPVHKGPIVLITIDALRADMVGALGGPPKVMPALS